MKRWMIRNVSIHLQCPDGFTDNEEGGGDDG